MRKRTGVILVCLAALLMAVAGVYIGIGMHYETHFFEHTTVNGIDVSDLTAEEAEALIAAQAEDYQVAVVTKEGNQEVVLGEEIGFRFVSGGEVQGFLEGQNPYAWLPAYFGADFSYTMEASVTYEEALLDQALEKLACMQEANVTAPRDAYVERQNGTYVIVPEVEGNRLDPEKTRKLLKAAVDSGERTLDLAENGCYEEPKVHASDGALKAEAAVRNRYSSITVTYQMGGGVTETLDAETTASWFSLDGDKQPVLDRAKVSAWVDQLADTYDTIGTWEPFVTSHSETVYVEARTYGWQMDREAEAEELCTLLMAGDSADRSPVYLESARTRGENDIGTTYVEIDYTNQRMWYYKDGSLLVETAVVTGNVGADMASPEGIFCLVGKERNATLKGEGYSTPVEYWMPFYGGVGIHDADTWRTSYGGTVYQWGGSHGCINTPTAQAAVIYENIEIGTPVICYRSEVNYGYGETYVSGGSASGGGSSQGEGSTSGGGASQGEGSASGGGSSQGEDGPSGAEILPEGGQDGLSDIIILDSGGSGAAEGAEGGFAPSEEDWADESLYYGDDVQDIIIEE